MRGGAWPWELTFWDSSTYEWTRVPFPPRPSLAFPSAAVPFPCSSISAALPSTAAEKARARPAGRESTANIQCSGEGISRVPNAAMISIFYGKGLGRARLEENE
eukprot:756424-Pelagomonas_calceolata.AAC.7